ncbi:hypothetical protein BCU70_01730 [Vibrio sp. 10N.286.49.C2]|uniref:DUF1800 family protein n=1 Tax=unclassified Vibrio TaxID=2614977 RepID=UPI000C81EFD9|nr:MULTISPECIES: DUF1800 family protein [unclassified Vibrio]PMH42901.1 hypothetical protein BCU70_01730 [Vibrio sp. 10N.286.49.C2]PMH53760.1 hypothetical protein BCU66_13105 [Vibrio sp. 10N.286.49.B1]PMH77766.1 hypothetical protein BCU58_11720 [Vibrio sp. 10N.286.48.B7]
MQSEYRDAARTLTQCTFGPSVQDIEAFIREGETSRWIETQKSYPATSWLALFESLEESHSGLGHGLYYASSWTQMTVEKPDALRQRIAYILSELFVVSVVDPAFRATARRKYMCNYYDGLARNGLGNFRDILRWVSTSPVMGEYLTFVNNVANESTQADENYARELLQLFTLGPVKLHGDGSTVTDDLGQPVPSYQQSDIENLARVFTGWTFANASGAEKYAYAMVIDSDKHDATEKTVLGQRFSAHQSAEEDLEQVIDLLMSQANLYTYVAKFFITKMVTSNPKPAYVRRVRNAFKNSDGDMATLIEAILTDRTADNYGDEVGKVRDPMCVFTHAMRALGVKRRVGISMWPKQFNWYDRLLPMSAPSVFYYYQPDDAPNAPDFSNLTAPEFAVYQWQDIYDYGHHFKELIARQENEGREWFMAPDLFELFLTRLDDDSDWDNQPVVDYLDTHLFHGQLSDEEKAHYLTYLASCTGRRSDWYREIKNLIVHALLSPKFIVQG